MTWIVFTDLDGTLLDLETYEWRPAGPALAALARAGIPVILNSSKTRAEIETLRRDMGHADPFIVENGAALFLPLESSVGPVGGRRTGPYVVVEWGTPYADIVRALDDAARSAGVAVRGFSAMSEAEVAERTNLPAERARLARLREYDEPFVVLGDDPGAADRIEAALAASGLHLTRGDRFHHVLGRHDKAAAARETTALYAGARGTVRTIALGDAPNDLEMLRGADVPIIVGSQHATALSSAVPAARMAPPGPAGWNQAILGLLAELT